MATLEWSETLALGVPTMDATHQEFVDLLAAVEFAADTQLLAAWQALVEHTEDHFAQEDRWMHSTGFAADNCHSLQHRVILEVMRDGAVRATAGELHVVRGMVGELATWFSHHAQTMDAALAQHLTMVNFDIDSGAVSTPQSLPTAPIHGCGGACSSGSDHVGQQARTAQVANSL